MKRLMMILVLMCAGWAMAQPEDVGEGSATGGSRAMSEIPAFTVDSVVLDFDALPVGPTTVAAIQAAFPNSAIADIVTVPRAATGNYGYQNASGNALACDPDGSGNLAIISSVDGLFGEADGITFVLTGYCTQFGFGIGDWSGGFNCNVYDGATNVGSIQVDTTTGSAAGTPGSWHVVESTVPFDRVELTALPDYPSANWVIHQIQTEQGIAIPTLSQWGLMAFIALFLIGALVVARRMRMS